MEIIQTIRLRATIPDDVTLNRDFQGQPVSWTDKHGSTFKFWAVLEKETRGGACSDLTGDRVDKHGVFYDYDERFFEIVDAGEPAHASAGAQAAHGDNDANPRAQE